MTNSIEIHHNRGKWFQIDVKAHGNKSISFVGKFDSPDAAWQRGRSLLAMLIATQVG